MAPATTTSLNDRRHLTSRLLRQYDRCREPGERAELLDRIVELNLDLADGIARQYAHRGLELDDLIQVARVGLVLAIQRFRPAPGAAFAAFAIPTIQGELKRHFRDHGWVVRPPRRIQELQARARARARELEQQLGRTPSSDELAAALGVETHELDECAAADSGFHPLSLDVPADPSGTPLSARLADGDDDGLESLPDLVALRRVLAGLPPRDRAVLSWRFGEGLTQSEIGARLGVSQMQVSRILAALMTRLRGALEPAVALAG